MGHRDGLIDSRGYRQAISLQQRLSRGEINSRIWANPYGNTICVEDGEQANKGQEGDESDREFPHRCLK